MFLEAQAKFIRLLAPYRQQFVFIKNDLPLSKPALLARLALLKEVYLTPKPGLVDRRNSGSHTDMDYQTFLRSINAISKWFDNFYILGCTYSNIDGDAFLKKIRPTGIACEQAMFKDTQGVNTHKGGIFAFGLLCGAVGRLEARESLINSSTICEEITVICAGIVQELNHNCVAKTVGEKLYQQYGFTGARGEAAGGYMTVQEKALPIYTQARQAGLDEQSALLQTLLNLMAVNNDTNVVSRGGLEGLQLVQTTAKKLLDQGSMLALDGYQQMVQFDDLLIKYHLSPGGSADLLGVTWFLAQYNR